MKNLSHIDVKKASMLSMTTLFTALSVTEPALAQKPIDIVRDNGKFCVLHKRETGDKNLNGPEFIVNYKRMHVGDMTSKRDDMAGMDPRYDCIQANGTDRGRAIDCDHLVTQEQHPGKWVLTARFLAEAADLADGSGFDSAFNQDRNAVVSLDFLKKYLGHINQAHHRAQDVMGTLGYCQKHYPPSAN